MFDLGMQELIVIFLVALIVIGPKKLPDLGRKLGKGLFELKKAFFDVKGEINREFAETREMASKGKDALTGGLDLGLGDKDSEGGPTDSAVQAEQPEAEHPEAEHPEAEQPGAEQPGAESPPSVGEDREADMQDDPSLSNEAPSPEEEAPSPEEEAPPSKEEAPSSEEEAPPLKEEAPPSEEEAPPKEADAPAEGGQGGEGKA